MQVDFDKLFSQFEDLKVMVVGDVMLDTYLWGNVDRISPEAPVPIVALKRKDHRLGGAANVALNIRSLGAEVAIFSVIGNDDDGYLLKKKLLEANISDAWLIGSDHRITTNKSRVMSRNQQMLRMDAEITHDLPYEDQQLLISSIEKYVISQRPQVLIFEDYNKGVLTENVIASVIDLCNKHEVITTVDPKRKNFFAYRNVTIFKPNLKEVTEALNLLGMEVNTTTLKGIHDLLQEKLKHKISFITLSEKGVFYNDELIPMIIPSHIRNISDVSGAGDTVIAVASLTYAATHDIQLTAEIANLAGGLVCEEVGTAAINKQRLVEECKLLLV